jgi:hypothetical protein
MKLIIHIYPDKDGVHCGKCKKLEWISFWHICWLFGDEPKVFKEKKIIKRLRLPECLKAEKEAKEKT